MARLASVNPWKRWVGHFNDWIIKNGETSLWHDLLLRHYWLLSILKILQSQETLFLVWSFLMVQSGRGGDGISCRYPAFQRPRQKINRLSASIDVLETFLGGCSLTSGRYWLISRWPRAVIGWSVGRPPISTVRRQSPISDREYFRSAESRPIGHAAVTWPGPGLEIVLLPSLARKLNLIAPIVSLLLSVVVIL